MKHVVAYLRASTDGQVGPDKYGLELQKKDIVEYCEANDYNIVRWFVDEGQSGAKERDVFESIIYGEVYNPPIEGVVVAKSDRVARDIKLYFYYKYLLEKKSIKLISVVENFGEMGPMAALFEAIVVFFAEQERENINKRTSGGRMIKASKGGYSGGKAPMGYSVDKSENKLVVNEEEAEIVRLILSDEDDGCKFVETVERLKEAGFKGRNGKDITIPVIQGIRRNRPTYEGYYRYGKQSVWVKGQHEAIIPPSGKDPNADISAEE